MRVVAVIAFGLMCFLVQPCLAQEDDSSDNEGIYGYSSLEVMSDTSIIGYTETDLDPSVASYYSAFVQGELKDANGNVITYQTDRGSDGQQVAAVAIEYDNATPDTTYTLTGSHRGVVEISDPCQGCNNSYGDYFDYQVYEQYDLDLEDEFEFLPQGSPQPSPNTLDLGSTYETAQATTPGPCNDIRDQIIQEYITYRVGYSPTCASFSQTASTANFTFTELNSGDYTWAILQQSLLSGIEQVRSNNGSVPLTVNSGYRNPKHNAQLTGAAANSRHQFGDAIDFASDGSTWQKLHDAGKQAGGCVEPLTAQGNNPAHCHIDWRGACPPGY